MNTLTDEDIDAIANRLLQHMGKRLLATEAPVAASAPPPKAEPPRKELPVRLAYTLKELSAELGVSKISIYRLTVRGLLRPLPYLRKKVFSRAEVERFLAAGLDWNTGGRVARKRPPGAT